MAAHEHSIPSKLTSVYKANSASDFDLGHDTDKLVMSEAEGRKKVLLNKQDSLSPDDQDTDPAEVRNVFCVAL